MYINIIKGISSPFLADRERNCGSKSRAGERKNHCLVLLLLSPPSFALLFCSLLLPPDELLSSDRVGCFRCPLNGEARGSPRRGPRSRVRRRRFRMERHCLDLPCPLRQMPPRACLQCCSAAFRRLLAPSFPRPSFWFRFG